MSKLTPTQTKILDHLDTVVLKAPWQIAESVTDMNCGGAARSLRKLMELGLIEQVQVGWFNRKQGIALYGYRRRP